MHVYDIQVTVPFKFNNDNIRLISIPTNVLVPGPVAQIQGSRVLPLAQSHTFVVIDHEIISTVILFLPLIQEGLLTDTSKSMCTKCWLTA